MATGSNVSASAPYLGDFEPGVVIRVAWDTNNLNGIGTMPPPGEAKVFTGTPGITSRVTDENGNRITDEQNQYITTEYLHDTVSGVVTEVNVFNCVGLHLTTIDLSVDPGFFAVGRDYWVAWVTPTLTAILAHFSIRNRTHQVAAKDAIQEVIAVDPVTELDAVPTFPTTPLNMLRWLFTIRRHKRTQNNSTAKVFKADGTTVLAQKPTSDNGTTFSDGPWE